MWPLFYQQHHLQAHHPQPQTITVLVHHASTPDHTKALLSVMAARLEECRADPKTNLRGFSQPECPEKIPSRGWIHIPPWEVRKIIDSNIPFLGDMLVPWRVIMAFQKKRWSKSKRSEKNWNSMNPSSVVKLTQIKKWVPWGFSNWVLKKLSMKKRWVKLVS